MRLNKQDIDGLWDMQNELGRTAGWLTKIAMYADCDERRDHLLSAANSANKARLSIEDALRGDVPIGQPNPIEDLIRTEEASRAHREQVSRYASRYRKETE